MGDANVGKTSIIKSFVDNTSMRNKTKVNTKVIEDFTKVITVQDNKNQTHLLKLNIYDAAGDAAVHNLAHLFLHDAKVGILCYSIDNKKSFDQLSEWYEHLQEKNEEMFIVIVGSKNDLTHNRAVPQAYAQKLKQEFPNCKFTIETSAFENIESIR